MVHRTVRWCTGLSGEPKALAANGRLCNQRATRGPLQRSVGHIGLFGAPTGPEAQRSAAPDMEGDRAPDIYYSSSLGLCVCAADLSPACVAVPLLLLCFLCDHHCKGDRLQTVDIPRKREEYSKKKRP
jgi:hypothetical protein